MTEEQSLPIRDHDLLIRLDQKVDGLTDVMRDIKDNTVHRLDDHEKRLRFVERYVWGAIAIIGLINIVGFATIFTIFKP